MQVLDVDHTIRQMEQDFAKRLNAKQTKELVKEFYAPNARILPNHRPEAKGHEAIRKTLDWFLENGFSDLTMNTSSVEKLGDVAIHTGTYNMKIKPAGAPSIADHGKYVTIFRRQKDDSWRCELDIFNSDEPVPGM